MSAPTSPATSRSGLIQAVGAYSIWGFMPLYFKQLQMISPVEVVAHRIVWSVGLLLLILWMRGRMSEYRAALAQPRTRYMLLLSSALIAVNWLIYIWAIYHDHILAASLGYYLNPLLNVLLGLFLLGERPRPVQWIAVALAALGVAVLASQTLTTIWISFALALSFGLYGLVRKVAPVGSLPGLGVETTLLFPLAFGFAAWAWLYDTSPGFGYSGITDAFLIAGGAVTAIPLLLFAAAAKKMSLATLGFIQYIGPTIQFLLGVFVYHEELTVPHMICFALIWTSLIVYSGEGWMQARRVARPV